MTISYREIKEKIVICKDGVYMAFTKKHLAEMKDVLADIEAGTKRFRKEELESTVKGNATEKRNDQFSKNMD